MITARAIENVFDAFDIRRFKGYFNVHRKACLIQLIKYLAVSSYMAKG